MWHPFNSKSSECWKYFGKRYQVTNSCYRNLNYCNGNSKLLDSRTFHSNLCARESVEIQSLNRGIEEPLSKIPKLNIRERLYQWENDNTHQHDLRQNSHHKSSQTVENAIYDMAYPFVAQVGTKSISDEVTEEEILQTLDISDGLEGPKRDFLIPGDLVDLRLGNNNNELAIFVQRLNLQSQFYTISGRLLHQRGTNINLYFPRFVYPSELDELKIYLLQGGLPLDQDDSLDGFQKILPRTIGGPLLEKMKIFWDQANAVYETTAHTLDESYRIVAHPTEFQYATISELADRILSGIVPKGKNGKFTNPALYALHRRIHSENIGFIPANLRKTRGESQYEILPLNLTNEMSRVIGYVRKLTMYNLSKGKSEKPTELRAFAKKAYELIHKSRQNRDFTTYGNIGPYRGKVSDELKTFKRENFTGTDLEFVRFIEIWAGLNTIGSVMGCTYDSAGSTILRSIGQYNKTNILLNKQTAWTCLKEIGAIPPWQIVGQYGIRAPNTSCRLSLSPGLPSSNIDYSIDKMRDYRVDWKSLTTYCIDDTDALELDDGLSLEATESPNEYWVHIHIADPTSILSPHSQESKYARMRGNTVFLPGCKVPMLDHDATMKHMSLAQDRLSLTFSAKLNFEGELLDSKISPGILRNVICITPSTFAEVNNISTTPNTQITFIVGPKILSQPSRKLVSKDQLSEKELNELQILNRLGEARALLLQKKGATFSIMEQDSLKVYFKNLKEPVISNDYLLPNIDPTIEIRLSGLHQDLFVGHSVSMKSHGSAIPTFMQLAGEIGADWCKRRGIPIPYRIALPQISCQDLADFHRQNILPFIEKTEKVPDSLVSEYLALIGPVHLSTKPAPHPALAMQAYTKVTSPLRRFLDMIVHWQINAAIRHQFRSDQTSTKNSSQRFVPFSESWLNSILPHMTRLERWGKYYESCSVQEWKCQFLLRVWKYSQCKLPCPLVFVAKRTVLGTRNCVFGELPCIAMKVLMEVPHFMNFEEINEGDLFDVKITDISIHTQKVTVKAIRKLSLEDIPRLIPEFRGSE